MCRTAGLVALVAIGLAASGCGGGGHHHTATAQAVPVAPTASPQTEQLQRDVQRSCRLTFGQACKTLPTLIPVRAQGSGQTTFFILGSSRPTRANTHSSGIDYPKLRPVAKFRHCGSFKRGLDGRAPGPSRIVAVNASCAFARSLALTGSSFGWQCVVPAKTDTVCWRGSSAITYDR